VVFVADDLGSWLVGLLADAARKKLTALLLGDEQSRALRQAATAAVQATAVETSASGGEKAEQFAMVISEVFRTPMPDASLTKRGTLLEGLQEGIATQLAVLDDATLTGIGQSSADVLGVPGTTLAARLTGHLVREIMFRGSRGGPLKPLADQLNFDAAHLNDRRAAGVLDRVHAGVLAILDRLDGQPVTVTAEEFASDVRALLEALAEQAAHGRLPSYLWGRADVLALSREVKVRSGIRKGASDEANAASGQAYALAADRGGQGSETMPWPEAVAAHDRVVVLADAGLGKSWLIRTETRRLASTALAQTDDDFAKVVIPVPLRCDQLAAAEGPDLPSRAASFLAGEGLLAARSRGPMTERIRAGRAVILLDALDELTSDEAGIVRGLIESWSRRAGPQVRVRCMITSRIAGYAGPPLPDAAEVELQPFTPGDVTQVIRAWQLPAAEERKLMGRASDPAVAAMARVPLLLVMLCALASEQPAGSELPRTRGELYERVLRWFLTRAHRSAGDPATQPLTDIQVEALLDLLAPIAFTFAASPGGWTDLMSLKDLFGAIRDAGPAFTDLGQPPNQVLTDLSADAGILVPDRDPRDGRRPRYLFLHRTFAEYLVARHLATRPADDYLPVIAQHQWFDPDWENVIAMFGGQLDSAGARELIEHLLASDPDPFWHTLLTAMTVAGERPDADTTLTGAQAARLAQATGMLLRHAFGRDLISDRMVRVTHLPQCVREVLLASLNDPDAGVRERAVQSLAGREDQQVISALLDRLRDHVADVRREAAAALGGLGGQEVTAALLARLDDPDPGVCMRIVNVLAGREGQHVTSALLARLDDPAARVRRRVVQALAGRQGQDVTSALLARLDDRDAHVRRQAVQALIQREGQDVTDALLARLDDPVADVRQQVAAALAEREGQHVTDVLLARLGNPDAHVRQQAVQALGGREGQDVTDALLARLGDPVADVRQQVAAALAGREGQDVTDVLLARLGNPDARERRQVAAALAGREGQDVTSALLARLGDRDANVRRQALQSLAGRRGQRISAALLPLLRNPRVRQQAVQALAGREGQHVTDALLARLGDPDAHVRQQAVQSLAGREGQEVTDALLARLGDPDARVRQQAVQSLAGREGQEVTDALLARLGDPDAHVRQQAVQALAGREGQDVTNALLARLNNPRVRQQAMRALSERGSPRDLLVLAQGMNRLALPPSEWFGMAYRLTTAFYNALPAGDRKMIRTAMGRITPVLPQDTPARHQASSGRRHLDVREQPALEPAGEAPAKGRTEKPHRPEAWCQMRDGTWQAVKVITWQKDGDRWRCLLQWGVSGAEHEGWYIHDPLRLHSQGDGRPPGT
jgi:HEAT repeat protein